MVPCYPRRHIDIIFLPYFRGAFLEDAVVVSCGHSFGGLMLRKVIEMVSLTVLLVPIKLLNVRPWWHLLRSIEHIKYNLIILFLNMKVQSLSIFG